MYEWRAQFGNVAEDVLTGHLSDVTPEQRISHVCDLLDGEVKSYVFKEMKGLSGGKVVCMHFHLH